MASFKTPEDALSESHGVDTSSTSTPSTSSTPSPHLATLSSLSSTHCLATSSTSSPESSASYIISSISSTSHSNWSIILYASGFSSSSPCFAIELIFSSPPLISFGSSKYFISGYFANIQCGFQPVIIIGSSLFIALSSSDIIAAVEDNSTVQPCKLSYSSIAASVATEIPAPCSIPVIV